MQIQSTGFVSCFPASPPQTHHQLVERQLAGLDPCEALFEHDWFNNNKRNSFSLYNNKDDWTINMQVDGCAFSIKPMQNKSGVRSRCTQRDGYKSVRNKCGSTATTIEQLIPKILSVWRQVNVCCCSPPATNVSLLKVSQCGCRKLISEHVLLLFSLSIYLALYSIQISLSRLY